LDGLQTTLAIREEEKKTGKHILIIAMTAHATKEDEARCREAGMDGFLPKPVEPAALDRTLAKFFPERLAASPEPEAAVELKHGIDLTALAKRVDQDADLFKEISQLFFEDAPRLLKEIESQRRAKDWQALTRLAHALKGSISNFCAPEPFS